MKSKRTSQLKSHPSFTIRLIVILTLIFSAVLETLPAETGEGPSGGALSIAVAAGDLDRVKGLVDGGADLTDRDLNGLTVFQLSTLHGHGKVVNFLATRGADRTEPMPSGVLLADRLIQRIVKPHSPGVAVLVSRDGKILFTKGYGLANRETKRMTLPDTKFRIGSVTKQFTAAAILKLQEQGKLNVNDALSKHLPGLPRGDEVTLRHLLTHTSGAPSYTGKPDFTDKVTSPIKPEALIDSFKNDPFKFKPGERFSYSNTGYFLLGHIVARVSGKSLGAFLRSEFFQPLGMNDTGVYRNEAPPNGEALGYSYDDGGLTQKLTKALGFSSGGDTIKRAIDWDMSWAGGAGALYSTVGDLHRWNEALFTGKVLSPSSLESALTSGKTADDEETGYGFGLKFATHRGLKVIGHGGGLHGFMSRVNRYPDANLTVVVLANVSPPAPEAVPGPLAKTIGEFFLWRDMPPRETFEVDSSVTEDDLNDFVGRYDFGKAVMTVMQQENKLFAKPTGQRAAELFPKSKDEFFLKGIEAKVTFVRDDEDRVIRMVLHQNGQMKRAPRLTEQKVVKVDSKILKTYVGKYDYGQAVLTITVEENRIFAQVTGQPRHEIFPKSQNVFFWKVAQAEVSFLKGKGGKIDKAHHRQNRREFDAPRLE